MLNRPAVGRPSSILILIAGLLALAAALVDPNNGYLALATIPIMLGSSIALAQRYPLGVLNGVVLVFMTANVRLGIARIGIQSGIGIRGWFFLTDLLLPGLVIGTILNRSRISKRKHRIPATVLLMIPYVALSIVLPLLGVMFRGMPPSYALPSVRCFQWLALAYIGYSFSERLGVRVTHGLTHTLLVASVLNAVYALLQIGYYQYRVIPQFLLAWDEAYVTQNFASNLGDSWFGWRVTGLHVNPNMYGIVLTLIMIAVIGFVLSGSKGSRVLLYVGATACVIGLVLSGSRTALFALVPAAIAGMLVFLLRPGAVLRRPSMGLGLIIVVAVVTGTAGTFLENVYFSSRFGDILSSVDNWLTDPSMVARLGVWEEMFSLARDYPFGTWAPPSYMFRYAVDSMYVQTFIQGTIFYTFTLILFISGALSIGWRCFAVNNGLAASAGFALAGWSLALAVASFSMVVLNSGEFCAPFATLVGCVMALSAGMPTRRIRVRTPTTVSSTN